MPPDLYMIHVNGIPFCEPVDKWCKDYALERLKMFPELKVTVTEVGSEEVRTA